MFKIIVGGNLQKDFVDLTVCDLHYENNGDSKIFWVTILFICFYWEK